MTATATRERPSPAPDSGAIEDERAANRRGLLSLAILVLLLAGVSGAFDVGGPVIVVVAILGMIMLHEFGHFITARWAGMRVTDFFVGFGPTLWSFKRGDTRYGVKGLPLGGFVRVIGMNNLEEIAPEDEQFTYRSKTYWQRVRFAAAGSFMHAVIAILLMVVLLAVFGRAVPEQATTTLKAVDSSLPAHQAGIRAGDKLVAINGQPMKDWDAVADAIGANPGRSIRVTVKRGAENLSLAVTPVDARTPKDVAAGKAPVGRIGITTKVTEGRIIDYSWPQAVWSAGFEVKTITVQSAQALVGLFQPESLGDYGQQMTKTGPADPADEGNRLLSPVGIFRIAGSAWDAGIAAVLFLLIAINVFVGIFNMVPLPPFDGGHVAVATYEAIRSRISKRRHMADMNKLLPLAYAVIFALMLLSVSALWLDIRHPFDLG